MRVGCEWRGRISGQSLERPFQCASLLVSLVAGVSRWQRSADVLYINEELAQGADAVQRGATNETNSEAHWNGRSRLWPDMEKVDPRSRMPLE